MHTIPHPLLHDTQPNNISMMRKGAAHQSRRQQQTGSAPSHLGGESLVVQSVSNEPGTCSRGGGSGGGSAGRVLLQGEKIASSVRHGQVRMGRWYNGH